MAVKTMITRIVGKLRSFHAMKFFFLLTFFSLNSYADIVSVMTYNAENLFDNKHDRGKNDYTYLPLAYKKRSSKVKNYCRSLNSYYYRKLCFELDWSDKTLDQKLQNLARVIKSSNRGFTPDILMLQEVENINVLRMLNKYLGYPTVILIEGPDKRGIDVGILAKFSQSKPAKLHPMKIMNSSGEYIKTRGMLEANFMVHGKELTVINNHWPSQMAPDEYRDTAARNLRNIVDDIDNKYIIVAGDFNTNSDDSPNGLNNHLLNYSSYPTFYDSFEMSPYSPGELPAPGTHTYRDKWEFLDRIMVWSAYKTGISDKKFRPIWKSYKLIMEPWMTTEENGQKVPKRFDPVTGEGVSDHLPVIMKFEFN